MNIRSEAEWLALFEDQKQSGLSAAAYCRKHSLCNRHFCKRRRELLGVPAKKSSSTFSQAVIGSTQSPEWIEMQYGFVKLRFPASISPESLSQFVQKISQGT